MSENISTTEAPIADGVPTASGSTTEGTVSMGTLYRACLAASIVCSILSVSIYDRFFATKIAVMDLPGYMSQISTALSGGAIDNLQMLAYVDAAGKAVTSVPKNYIVISGDVILGPATHALKIKLPEVPKVAPKAPENTQGLPGVPATGNPALPMPSR